MASLDTRAHLHAYTYGEWMRHDDESFRISVTSYKQGAIDYIDKACEWLKKNLTLNGEDNETIIEFRKAMEE